MKFKCSGCSTIWEEKEVFRVEHLSKSAFCRACSCKCNPMVDKADLMKFFDMSEEDLAEETPPEIPEEAKEEKNEDELESQIISNYKEIDLNFPRADDEDPWDI